MFILANIIVYYLTEINGNQRIEVAKEDNIQDLKSHYKILLHHQKITADGVYLSTISMVPHFIELYSKIKTASKEEKNKLRKQLYNLLKNKYEILKINDILQYHFFLPNNESFLRMHKPSKFGDDLSNVREDVVQVNATKKKVRGFVQGRVVHGFRNTYPIFDKKNNYLGAMEVSFSSDSFQDDLNNISNIHTHFIILKDIFDAKTWARDDLVLKYVQSSDHNEYMLSLNKNHSKKRCIIDNKIKLSSVRDEIDKKIKYGDPFAVYVTDKKTDNVKIVSFFPIYNLSKTKTISWLVSYVKSDFAKTTLQGNLIIRLISFFSFFIVGYLLFKKLVIQKQIGIEHRLLEDVLNSTDNIMFVTNFKEITFSNRKFKDFFNVKNESEFNKKVNNDMLSIFIKNDGYLHADLLKKKDSVINYFSKTAQTDRVVSILDISLNPKAFNINITKTSSHNVSEYLVTLTDITMIKEKELKIQYKADYDGLTKVYNRNKFNELLEQEFIRDNRYKRHLSITLIDIDDFKNFNDTFGHLIGDEVLIMLAKYISNNIRDTDTFARWGGEEFVILFPETTEEIAEIICNKLREGIESMSHLVAGSITASFGITQCKKSDTIDGMFNRCDEALYMAKENGRNMVCVK